ncbi:MAG: polysaccharide deacetylase family protein [Patescibacteria group bacterium]|nr:polysaccharide deacetylase family protein [Patescibacteria group bacterium]
MQIFSEFRKIKKGFYVSLFLIAIVAIVFVIFWPGLEFILRTNIERLSFEKWGLSEKKDNNIVLPSKELKKTEEPQKNPLGKKVFAPILAFHHIATPPASVNNLDKNYFVDAAKLESIIQELESKSYQFVFVSQIVDYLERGLVPPQNIIALTFDDGDEDFYVNAWPILKRYNIKSSIYLMTGAHTAKYLSAEQILELDKSGLVEVGSHTVNHPFLTHIPKEVVIKQLKDSKDYLEKLLNKKVEIVCYPFGLTNKEIEAVAREVGYRAGLKYNYNFWQDPNNLMEMSRLGVMPNADIMKLLEKMRK